MNYAHFKIDRRILLTIQIHNEGVYRALIAQLDKLHRHNRQGSFRTRERYYKAMKRFCRFLAERYRSSGPAQIPFA